MGIPDVKQNQRDMGRAESRKTLHKWLFLLTGIAGAFFFYFLLPAAWSDPAKAMISLLLLCVFYWICEPVPLGLTAILLLVLLLVFRVVSMDVLFSGFSSPAVFLIIAGMMLANGVKDTPLISRMTYTFLARWGGTAKGLLASILVLPQLQAFFIPAAAVRTALVLPAALLSLERIGAKKDSPLTKMVLLGVAFGGTISGTAVMTAAIGNMITVELLNEYLELNISYWQWFYYTFPVWVLMVPAAWFVLLKRFPLTRDEAVIPDLKEEGKRRLEELGSFSRREIKCLSILMLTVVLWFTEPLHGFHPSIPALIAVILMGLPGTGCSTWEKMVKINFDTVILMGVTLSLGFAFNRSGAAALIGESLSAGWLINLLSSPVTAVLTVLILTHVLHLAVSNVSTAVITLIPIFIGLSEKAGADPVLICVTAAVACLHGYILVVESTPNIVVHSTGRLEPREYIIPGLQMTVIMTVIMMLTALTWWKWVGLLS